MVSFCIFRNFFILMMMTYILKTLAYFLNLCDLGIGLYNLFLFRASNGLTNYFLVHLFNSVIGLSFLIISVQYD